MAARPGIKAIRKMNRQRNRQIQRGFRSLEICTSKTRFATQESAERALERALTERTTHHKPVRTYPCELCSGWHLTSRQPRGEVTQ
jgi:hypothetical protein